jgi:serine phosphatase RsbU (regulator of sigma subunit)
MVKVAFSSQLPHGADPARTLAGMNETLHGNLGDSYLTAGYFVLDTGSRKLSWAGAAHPPLLIWRAGAGSLEKIPSSGGLIGPFPRLTCRNQEMDLAPGDRVIIYTDGIVEALNEKGDQYGIEAFCTSLKELNRLPAESLANTLLERIRRWAGHRKPSDDFDDDLTLIILDIQQLP